MILTGDENKWIRLESNHNFGSHLRSRARTTHNQTIRNFYQELCVRRHDSA